jgi:hypothetical protein
VSPAPASLGLICGAPHSGTMAANPNAELTERLVALERELRDLRLRVAALERLMGAGSEHPTDDATVRKKVAYDWQA